MSYTLTLTSGEREAIDWVGHRYSNGNALYDLLWGGDVSLTSMEVDWDREDEDITFHIPEYVAWEIKDNAESEDGYWPCFAKELADKMQAFCDDIV